MQYLSWNHEKNEWLKAVRGVGFEDVQTALMEGKLLAVFPHPNSQRYPGQSIYIVVIHGYAYLVPFVENDDEIFLKTIIPSRKATKKYIV